VVVFLLLPVDMLLTLMNAAAVAAAGEATPLMRWALYQGMATLVIVDIVAATAIVGIVHSMLWLVPLMSGDVQPSVGVMLEGWIGLGLTAGLWLFINTLTVYLFRENVLLEVVIRALSVGPG